MASNSGIKKPIPEPTIRRIPLYYQFIRQKHKEGAVRISCSDIALYLKLNPVQIRKDLSMAGASGRAKTGYDVQELLTVLEEFLGYKTVHDAFIVGAGHLGMALLGYEGFREYGLNIVAAFDTDSAKIGGSINGKSILNVQRFSELVGRMGVKIGIITVPAAHAQKVADMMVEAGIISIWSFAPVPLDVPENIILQYENLASSLAVLSKKTLQVLKKA